MAKEQITLTFVVNVSEDTNKHQDLILRQLIRQLTSGFFNIPPVKIAHILHDEATEITAIYPSESMQEMIDERPY